MLLLPGILLGAAFVCAASLLVAAVKLLLGGKAGVDEADKDGWTPLLIAAFTAQQGHTEAVKLLLAAKAGVDARNKNGWLKRKSGCWPWRRRRLWRPVRLTLVSRN